jgi:hypothetical protein
MTAPARPPKPTPPPVGETPFHARMLSEARALRAAAEAAFLPAVRSQLMTRVFEFENAATGD